MTIKIINFSAEHHTDVVRALFREYEQAIGLDLCFQHFAQELADLPGRYAPPGGALLLAVKDGAYAGCAAMREFSEGISEMKRLYIKPQFRNLGLGRVLAEEIVTRARQAGYAAMYLDTLETMEEALSLYRSLGFLPVGPYYNNPLANVVYLKLDLKK